jgi:uncharacterized protein YkwD
VESIPLGSADLVLLGLLALFAFGGYQRGFVHEVLEIVGLALAVVVALLTFRQVGAVVDRAIGLPPHVVDLVAFAGVFLVGLVVFAIVSAVVAWPIELTVSRLGLHRPNSLLGALPALLKGVVILGFGLRALALAPIDGGFLGELTTSRVGRGVEDAAAVVLPYGEGVFDEIAEQATRFVPPVSEPSASRAGEESRLNVPRGLTTWPDPDSEAVMLRLLNQERTLAGRQPLTADERLREVARGHSEEMFRLGYFAHESPTAGGPFDRLRQAGIRYAAAGENLAYAPTVEAAHRGLMNSPDHRRNILAPEFRKVGIGALQSGLWGRMFTQVFTS